MNNVFRLHKNIIAETALLIASALSIIAGGVNIYFLIFSITMHELGHISVALLNGAKVENFKIHGFGVELTFPGKNPTPKKLFYISAGGPITSLIIALIAYLFGQPKLFIINMCVCVINLLPVYPLDGGNIFYSIMSVFFPRTRLRTIFKTLGRFFGIVISIFGILILYISPFNISLIYMGLFIFFSSGRLQNPVVEITSTDYSKIEKASLFVVDSSLPILEAAGSLPVNSVGAIKDKDGKIISLVTPLYLYEVAAQE